MIIWVAMLQDILQPRPCSSILARLRMPLNLLAHERVFASGEQLANVKKTVTPDASLLGDTMDVPAKT